MTTQSKFYVTTPIYYVTAKPHLGHLYSTVIADSLARWHKLKKNDVFFLTGTDEFGQKIAQAAEKAGKQPQEFVDSFIDAYKNVWKDYHIEYDVFMRTTNQFHIEAVQKWISQLMEKGDIYKSFYKGWYCTHCETFVTEHEVSSHAPDCPTCGRPTQMLSEEAYFFKLSAYQDKLLKLYEEHPDFIWPKERVQEVINFVKSGLKDLSISRTTISWGVPFPHDTKHVTYVWADALNNYITAVGYGQKGKETEFKKWWPADVQVMGKDIIRFHAIYWPAFLMASGLAIPKHLLVHGWFKVGGQKMSKSFGNVIDPVELQKVYGADPVRYYLLRHLAITHDGEFSIEDLEQRISSELADDLGNLLNRMVMLCGKYELVTLNPVEKISPKTHELMHEAQATVIEFQKEFEIGMFHMALARVWKLINHTNAYFHSQEPWKIAKTNPTAFAEIMWATAQSLHTIAILLWPVMPTKMEALLASLGNRLNFNLDQINELIAQPWKNTFMITKIDALFVKPAQESFETYSSAPQDEKVGSNPIHNEADSKSLSRTIDIEEFSKVELTVGTIVVCEEIPASDKLYKLQVDFGQMGMRQILSGIRKAFTSEELIGKQAIFVTNLKPRKMMGLESQGMLLTAQTPQKELALLTPSKAVENGTRLK